MWICFENYMQYTNMKILENIIILISTQFCQWWYFSTQLYVLCPVLSADIKVLSFLTQTCWVFSLIYLYCPKCSEDGLNSSPDDMHISSLKINFEWKPSFISIQTSKFKWLGHKKQLVNISLNKYYFWHTIIKMYLYWFSN